MSVNFKVNLPEGWHLSHNEGQFLLPAEASTSFALQIETPVLSAEQLKTAEPQEITVQAEADGKPAGEVKLRVLLRASGLPQ